MKKRLAILGSTGSIGRSALDVVDRHCDRLEVVALTGHTNFELLLRQVEKYSPKYVTLTDEKSYIEFKRLFNGSGTELIPPPEGLSRIIRNPDIDIVLNAIVGAAGLKASVEALRASKRLALANKESMVAGGDLLNDIIDSTGSELIPVDSEHSAIFQAMRAGEANEVKKIILTASGGPFRDWPLEKMKSVSKKEALAHPTWKMGPKITIDSATMMNKGLEVIEAVQLFRIPPERIEVVIHPQSIIHSMVEFRDSSVIAQLSNPDMRLPIAYSFFYPERVEADFGRADFGEIGSLSFEKPDFEKFPLLKAAFGVARKGGTVPAVYNAANEIAVSAFLDEKIKFQKIAEIVINIIEKYNGADNPSYEDILEADRWGRETATRMIN